MKMNSLERRRTWAYFPQASSGIGGAGGGPEKSFVAFLDVVLDGAGNRDGAVARSLPAADGGVGEVVAGMAAVGGDADPAERGVGPLWADLPGVAGEMRESGEIFYFAAGVVEFAVAVLPGSRDGFGGRRWSGFLAGEVDELECRVELLARGLSLMDDLVELLDSLRGILDGSDVGATGAGALDDEGGVHQEQRLLRDRRVDANGGVDVGVGEVEGAKCGGEELTIDEAVNGAAFREGFFEHFHGPAPHGEVEIAAGEEQRVAHGFEIEAGAIHSGKQAVFGVFGDSTWIVVAGLLISCREHDLAVEFFDGPAIVHEVDSEIVEKLGMRGSFAAGAEVGWGGDEAVAEMVLPDAIDED